jgi:hypothetical protein
LEKYDHIFISHATKDQQYVKGLVDLIELTGFNSITCSSHPVYSIPQDENIYDYLKTKLTGKVWVLFILSKDYYNSPACLNEMGAAWVLSHHYTSILLPNFKFEDIKGSIDPRQISFRLNDDIGLNEFKENLVGRLGATRPKDHLWASGRDETIAMVNDLSKKELKLSPASVEIEEIIRESRDTVSILFRCKNNFDYPVHFRDVKISLYDNSGNVYNFDINIDAILEHKENRLISKQEPSPPSIDPFSQISWSVDNFMAYRKYNHL